MADPQVPRPSYDELLAKYTKAAAELDEKTRLISGLQQQNKQLWQLIRKQRTMIFDYRKDLGSISPTTSMSPGSPSFSTSSVGGGPTGFGGSPSPSPTLQRYGLAATQQAQSPPPPPRTSSLDLHSSSSSSILATAGATGIASDLARLRIKQTPPPPPNNIEEEELLPAAKLDREARRRPPPLQFEGQDRPNALKSPMKSPPLLAELPMKDVLKELPMKELPIREHPEKESGEELTREIPERDQGSEKSGSLEQLSQRTQFHQPPLRAEDTRRLGTTLHDEPRPTSSISQVSDARTASQLSNRTATRSIVLSGSSKVSPGAKRNTVEKQIKIHVQPNDLPSVRISVQSTLCKPHTTKRHETLGYSLSCRDLASGEQLWCICKDYGALVGLDNAVRPHMFGLPRLPDKQVMNSSSPVKIDQRRTALNEYFAVLFSSPQQLPQSILEVICAFISSDVEFDAEEDHYVNSKASMSGYLVRRGRNFGGWKCKYYEIEGSFLNYYDRPGGSFSGAITLYQAKIGRQESNEDEEEAHEYRHGLLIMELKKKDQYNRFILCAETDEERERWIDALVEATEIPSYCDMQKPRLKNKNSLDQPQLHPSKSPEDVMSSVTVLEPNSPPKQLPRPISGPLEGSRIQDESKWGIKSQYSNSSIGSIPEEAERKKFSLFKNRDHLASVESTDSQSSSRDEEEPSDSDYDSGSRTLLFGSSISAGVQLSAKELDKHVVPAIVYRCVEFLEVRGCIYEEGVFRLSGSSSAIRRLKERFNHEFDVDLVAAKAEPHAVTSLLKLYLRELADLVIPRSMNDDFRIALEMTSDEERIECIKRLMVQLPKENYDLLYVLCGLLTKIIAHQELNKMTLRNVAIVFSPTLNIPANILVCLLTDYDCIFK
ncbi:hypothetical protein TRVA0_001S02344 [Trichomonascus vanleenenianus]|uniref:GTPase-activating protein BEM3 n=1 Tax=Trichomonascus vanleenenianus TaxID=2268995 RepID=UPI003EC96C5A